MGEYLNELNDVQRQAVTTLNGPVMVIAGPGSGKTRVLTFRVAELLRQGVKPWNILALTFTNKAAREMKDRIEKLTGPMARDVWAGTFHSLFARILRVESEHIGFPSNFTIYDTDDSKSLLGQLVKSMNLDKNLYNIGMMRARISSAKSNLITPKRYAQDQELLDQDEANRRPQFKEVYKKYVEHCQMAHAMDFDDLLLKLHELFWRNKQVLEKYQQRFQYVLVDEFQDTNHLQYEIVKQLTMYPNSHQNICIVGDDAQSIYSFRGATIANILEFERDFPDSKVYKLEQNYRSTESIVAAANEVISYNKNQIRKKIWTDQVEGAKIKLLKGLSDVEEGRMVVDRILEQKNRNHLKNSQIAILYRTNAQSRVFEEQLRRANITYRVFGGLSFYQRKEVKDLMAYLRLTVNPNDNEAFKRVVNYPKRGIGNTTMTKLLNFASEKGLSVWRAMDEISFGTRTDKLLQGFKLLIADFVKETQNADAYQMAGMIFHKSGLQKLMKSDISMEGMGRLENVNALLDGIQEFTAADEVEENQEEDKSLASYIKDVALITDFDQDETDNNYVTLMSAHSAKGLEFPSVFVVGLEENLFPSYMSMSSPDQLDEERRLFYVAITRAERFLTLSYANSRYQYGQIRYNDPSRFVDEISEELFETTLHGNGFTGKKTASVSGIPLPKKKLSQPIIVPKDFRPSPISDIVVGAEVLHLKFGKGMVKKLEGNPANRIATIYFDGIDDPERKIMLKFAKLQVKR